MKKILIISALALSSFAFAQDKRAEKERLTPEQQTELQVKKMTLDLDLTAKQQKEVKTILLEKAQKRATKIAAYKANKEKGQKRTTDEKFKMRSEMLDEQLAMKAEMKKILTAEQFNKWELKKENQDEKMAKKAMKRKEKRKENTNATK